VAREAANHFELAGKGISGVVHTVGPAISLQVDGTSVDGATLAKTDFGYEISGLVDSVPDAFDVIIRLTFPQVNLNGPAVTFTGFAVLVRARTSIGGPGLVTGELHLYEIRPIAGTASVEPTRP
jgi:hypothetical protein